MFLCPASSDGLPPGSKWSPTGWGGQPNPRTRPVGPRRAGPSAAGRLQSAPLALRMRENSALRTTTVTTQPYAPALVASVFGSGFSAPPHMPESFDR